MDDPLLSAAAIGGAVVAIVDWRRTARRAASLRVASLVAVTEVAIKTRCTARDGCVDNTLLGVAAVGSAGIAVVDLRRSARLTRT